MPIESPLPKFIAPPLPILSAEPPEGSGWIHENKHGGFRTLLRIDVELFGLSHAEATIEGTNMAVWSRLAGS